MKPWTRYFVLTHVNPNISSCILIETNKSLPFITHIEDLDPFLEYKFVGTILKSQEILVEQFEELLKLHPDSRLEDVLTRSGGKIKA